MNKPALYRWWIGLLVCMGSMSYAQENQTSSPHFSESTLSSCQTNCFDEYILQGNHYFDQQAYDRAIPYFEHALRVKRKEENPQIVIQCLIDLSLAVAYDNQLERARAHLEEAAWHLRQQAPNLFQIKSNHLITQIRQTVDSLEKVHQNLPPNHITNPVSSTIPIFRRLQKVIQYGASTGFIVLFFVFWIAVHHTGKVRNTIEKESAQLKRMVFYLQEQSLFEKEEKQEILHQNKLLAANMQDGLGNLISSVKLHVEQMDESGDMKQLPPSKNLKQISSWLEQACVDLRDISQQLMERQAGESGLIKMLNQLKAYLLADGLAEVKIFHHGFEKELSLTQASEIYGIIMNWTRFLNLHGQANEITIQLHLDQDSLNLIIEDDDPGCLLDIPKNSEEALVLSEIKRRIAAMRGKIEIDSTPGSNNVLVVELGGVS